MTAPRRAATPWLVAAAGYTALSIVYLWPIVTHLTSAWPHDLYDPAISASVLSWNARFVPLTEAWWNAPIFWPVHGALSYSEHFLGISLLTTPLLWAGATPLTAYNVAFLCAFPLTALAAHALAFACVRRHDVAAIGGCLFGFGAYRISQLPHIQMLWAFGPPLVLAALHRFVERGDRRWLVAFGLAWLATASANGYFMLFVPVLLAAWTVWFVREPSRVVPIAGTWALASLPLAPLLLRYAREHAAAGLSRTLEEIKAFSADITAVFAASPDLVLWHRLSRWSRPEGELFPGAVALLLAGTATAVALGRRHTAADRDTTAWRIARTAAIALATAFLSAAVSVQLAGPWKWVVGQRTLASASSMPKPLSIAAALLIAAGIATPTFRSAWRRRSVFGFYASAAVMMLMLSFGPSPAFAGVQVLYRAPYAWLMMLPGFSEVRVPARFGSLFELCLAIAAAIGCARLTANLAARTRRLVVAAVVVVSLVESWPRIPMGAPAERIPALLQVAGGAPVLELPLGITERDAAAMLRSIDHRHPIVNGYSGYDPPHYKILKIGLASNDGGVIDELARDSDLLVVVDRGEQFARWARVVGPRPVIADDGRWRTYRVPAGAGPQPVVGHPLSVKTVTANFHNAAVADMLDGHLETAWGSGRAQAGGESLLIDLGRPQDLTAVRLALGPFTFDFPRGLSAECSADAQQWAICWRGSATALALRAVLDDPLSGWMILPLSAPGVRYVRLTQTSADPVNGWAVAELVVLGR